MTKDLQPFSAGVGGLPDPTDLRRAIRAAVDTAYLEAVQARGAVNVPADTFDLQRKLAAALELFKAYQRAFGDAVRLIGQLQEEQLIDAVGEQAGVPNQPLTVPDPAGDIRVGLDVGRVHNIDHEQLINVVASQISAGIRRDAGLAMTAIRTFLSLGKFEAQVTKVRAYAAELARDGADDLAAVVSGTINTFTTYKGIKFERRENKS